MLDTMEPTDRPEIIVCGLDSSDELVDELISRDYGAQGALRLVVLANAVTGRLLRMAAAAGVHAVLSKEISGEILHHVLDLVKLGQRLFPAPDADLLDGGEPEQLPPPRAPRPPVPRQRPHLRLAVIDTQPTDPQPHVQLSEREAQILRCLGEGAPNKRIARDLDITEATVKVHIKGLLRKLRVKNRTQAAVWGLNHPHATDARPNPAIALSDRLPSLRVAP